MNKSLYPSELLEAARKPLSAMRGLARRLSYLILILLALVAGGGCRSHKGVIKFPGGNGTHGNVNVTIDASVSPDRRRLIEVAHEWLGTPYEYAASDKGRGSDCSGMVIGVYQEALGKKLPRNSAKQAEFCKRIKHKDVRPGDLVFFATGKDPDRISHVGIMLDSESFIHVSSSKGTVISSIEVPYYIKTFKEFGRVPGLE